MKQNTTWLRLANNKQIIAADVAALCIYLAIRNKSESESEDDITALEISDAASRLKRAFSPITNTVKLANGADPYYSLKLALFRSKYSAFAQSLTGQQQAWIAKIAQELRRGEFR